MKEQTYAEWRKIICNDVLNNLDSNKLAKLRRDIIKNRRLNAVQIDQLRNEHHQVDADDIGEAEGENVVVEKL